MNLSSTVVFYFAIGIAVASTVFVRERQRTRAALGKSLGAVFFWPIFVPILLQPTGGNSLSFDLQNAAPKVDEIGRAIRQVEAELDGAITSLDGWAEDVLLREHDKLAELRHAWQLQAARIRQIDQVLADLEKSERPPELQWEQEPAGADAPGAGNLLERAQQSEAARLQNICRLKEVRKQAHRDLLSTLAWVRELVTMIHLAKFTGAPAERGEALVAQIAAAVEGLSEVSLWHHESSRQSTDAKLGPENLHRAVS